MYHISRIMYHISYHQLQRNRGKRKGVKTVRRNKVDKMEPTVFLQRLRLAASSRLLNILSVAGGQLPGRVRWESSEAEGINKLRERASALERRVRTARRQRRRRHRGPKLHLPQLPPSFLGGGFGAICLWLQTPSVLQESPSGLQRCFVSTLGAFSHFC